jgi:tetratricopeptide (TPR) repeat protein
MSDSPLYVLALARPEIQSSFPHLWRGYVQPLQLRPISRKASERLVKQFLGGVASATAQIRIVEQADGNPLWLEELIRMHAEGGSQEVPPTILAMLQARIGQMAASDRQFLRAASVFGEVFWLGGVQALLQHGSDSELQMQADALVKSEILISVGSSRYAGQRELRFRHSLMRDAAYSLLTEEDCVLGHRLACVFLETQDESEAAVLAEHARRGADRVRAMQYYSRAAEEALAGNDLPAARHHAQAGLACDPTSEARGKLRAIEASARQWAGELQEARTAGLDALSLLPSGSRRWFQALHALWMTTTYLGEAALFRSLQEMFRCAVPNADAVPAYVECASFLIVMTSLIGQAKESREFLDKLERETAPYIAEDIAMRGWVRYAQGVYCHWIESDLWRKAELATESVVAADCIGDRRMRCLALTSLGLAQMGLGNYVDGEATFRQAIRLVQTMQGENYLLGSTNAFFAACLLDRGDPSQLDEAVALSHECLSSVAATSASAGLAQVNLARGYLLQGRLADAERHAALGEATLRVEPAVLPIALAALSQSQALRGNADAALGTVRVGLQCLQQVGTCSTELDLLACAAEIFARCDELAAARSAWTECVLRLSRNAERIPDPSARRRYLHEVPLNKRILKGAQECLGGDAVQHLWLA